MQHCVWLDKCCLLLEVVEPKRVALRGAEALLIAANAQLQEKQAALKAVEQKVAALEAALAAAEAEQASLGLHIVSESCMMWQGSMHVMHLLGVYAI